MQAPTCVDLMMSQLDSSFTALHIIRRGEFLRLEEDIRPVPWVVIGVFHRYLPLRPATPAIIHDFSRRW